MDEAKVQELEVLAEDAKVATTVMLSFPGDATPPVERTFKRDVLFVLKPGLYVMSGQYDTDENDKYHRIQIMSAQQLGAMQFEKEAK